MKIGKVNKSIALGLMIWLALAGMGSADTLTSVKVAATPTPVATIAAPTATPKAPAFEGLFAVGALLVAVLVRRRQV